MFVAEFSMKVCTVRPGSFREFSFLDFTACMYLTFRVLVVQGGSIVLSSSSASLVITIYDIRIRPYDLWACTFSLHVQKREGRAVGYLLLAPHRRQRHRRDAAGHRAVPAVCSWRI